MISKDLAWVILLFTSITLAYLMGAFFGIVH